MNVSLVVDKLRQEVNVEINELYPNLYILTSYFFYSLMIISVLGLKVRFENLITGIKIQPFVCVHCVVRWFNDEKIMKIMLIKGFEF